jgi:hypothetical protein
LILEQAQWSKGMAKIPPELIERFVSDRDRRRKTIAACSGIEHQFTKQLCELATHELEWIERWCETADDENLPDWFIEVVDVEQRIAEVNCHIGSLRAAESAEGKDHTTSTEILKIAFIGYFKDWDQSWRKTQQNAYFKGRESFEAVFEVWAKERGVAKDGFQYHDNPYQKIVAEHHRSKRPRPACLWPDIYTYVANETGQGASTLRRHVDKFCKMAPHFVLCNLEKGCLEHDPVIHKWWQFMFLRKLKH